VNELKSERGIYYNILDSDYTANLSGITFYFTSMVYRDKFIDRSINEIRMFNARMNNIYKNKFNIDATKLALVRLYQSIEKRGFYIELKGEKITCPNNLTYALRIEIDNELEH